MKTGIGDSRELMMQRLSQQRLADDLTRWPWSAMLSAPAPKYRSFERLEKGGGSSDSDFSDGTPAPIGSGGVTITADDELRLQLQLKQEEIEAEVHTLA
eukprot:Skav217912  [mRNA]  locus=scaffold795:200768:205403:+ [translate_table: standard]